MISSRTTDFLRRSSRGFVCVMVLVAMVATASRAGPEHRRDGDDESRESAKEMSDAEVDALLELLPPQEVDVSLVLVPTLVLDGKGRAVTGLSRDAFSVEVEGEPRPVAWFDETGDRAIRIALLVDVSESMNPPIVTQWLRVALLPLMRRIRTDRDQVMLLSFAADEVTVETAWNARPLRVLDRLIDIPRQGRTAMNDAISRAAEMMPRDPLERQAIVLVTDGIDNASEATAEEVIRRARGVGTPVYIWALAGPSQVIQDRRSDESPFAPLRRVAHETGARIFLIPDGRTAEQAAEQLVDDLRHQYVVAFRPDPAPDGAFHALTVLVDSPGVTVHTRSGYR